MEIKISSDNNNKLFKRREIGFMIIGEDKTPSALEVRKELCKKLNISPDATLIKELEQAFGEKLCKGIAVSYESAEALQKNEQKHKLGRRAKAEEKANKPKEEQKE